MRLFLAGDTILLRPWSRETDPAFRTLVDAMRSADATLVNLETSIHDYAGFAQAESGGAWLASPPAIAGELAWAGVDLVSHANNHAFDFGSEAVLETGEHVAKAGIVLAGSGRDLQTAAAPRFFTSDAGRVGLVAAAATFVSFGRASASRADLPGRPGLNPLALDRRRSLTLTPESARRMQRALRRLGFRAGRFEYPEFHLGPIPFRCGDRNGIHWRPRPTAADRRRNLEAVAAAAADSDCTVFSLHAHSQKPWLRRLAHEAVEAGADVVFVHGPHEVRGVEVRNGRPIFYGLGDFAFQTWSVERLPQEFYDRLGLGDDVGPAEAIAEHVARGASGFLDDRSVWEGLTAELELDAGRVAEIRLLPVELGYEQPPLERGVPRRAGPAVARRIVEDVARRSRRLGTRVEWDAGAECGRVVLPAPGP